MAQKFLAPFKNIHGFKKGHDGKKGKLPSELFQYVKCGDIGFPERPSALAYDASLDLVALGTAEGVIKVLGRPDVEFACSTPHTTAIHHISFIPHQGRFVTLCGSNELLLWQLIVDEKGVGTLDLMNSLQLPNESDRDAATCICLDADHRRVFVGLASGTISVVNLDSFALAPDEAITVDRVLAGLSKEVQSKLAFGDIAGLALCPQAPRCRLLIGYSKGLAVLWNSRRGLVERVMPGETQDLESVTWTGDNQHLMACYADGSYVQWELVDEEEADGDIILKSADPPNQPYGPFPCKAITHILHRPSNTPAGQPFIIFAGGMPRASFGDRHTVSVINDSEQVCFDFTSPVVDFLTLDEACGGSVAHTLLVLLEQELVAIDLRTEGWPLIPPPYLCALHSSSITAVRLCDNVPRSILTQLEQFGRAQRLHPFSPRTWPIQGGRRLHAESRPDVDGGQLLLTGHEDGSVSMWAVGGAGSVGTKRLYTLHTSALFSGDFPPTHEPGQYEHEEAWPPFRRTGVFDPYSDDVRLAIKQLELQIIPPRRHDAEPSVSLAIGGAAGQLSVWHLNDASCSIEVDITKAVADIIPKASQSSMEWRGPEALPVKEGHVEFVAGFQPQMVAQLEPPAPITALAHSASLGLLAAGTAHGLAVMDTREARVAYSRCTLPDTVLAGAAGDHSPVIGGRSGTMASRGLTLKKSLRNSFRRLRKFRSSRRAPGKPPATPDSGPNSVGEAPDGTLRSPDGLSAVSTTGATVDGAEDLDRERASVERSVEARWAPNTPDGSVAIIRCLLFVDTSIVSGASTTCLLSGGNGGTAQLHIVRVNRQGEASGDGVPAVSVELRKELQLQHRAPILHMAVVEARPPHLPVASPLCAGANSCPSNVATTAKTATQGDSAHSGHEHELLIVSEEQVKLFSLPHLKPRHKAKLTATDGNRLKAAGVQRFPNEHHEEGGESGAALGALCVLNTAGQCVALSLPQLKRLGYGDAISPHDVVGVNSGRLLQPCPLGLFQSAPGQLSLFSLTAQHGLGLGDACTVELQTGTRPAEQAGTVAASAAAANGGDRAESSGTNAASVNFTSTPEAMDNHQQSAHDESIVSFETSGVTSSGEISTLLGGDVTIDSIKDFAAAHPIFDLEKYLRGEEEPVVKRTELVLERKTLISGGKVVTTTTTEKEVVDGRIVREETRTNTPQGLSREGDAE